jgi:hypothetical protein
MRRRASEPPRDSGESIEDAIADNQVSFSQQFTALYRQYRVPRAYQAHWTDIYRRARKAFEADHGNGVKRSWYADPFAAGVAMTRDDTLHEAVWFDELDFDSAEALALWTDLRTLHGRIDQYLEKHPRDRLVCLNALYDLFASLISTMAVEWRMHRPGERTPSDQFGKSLAALDGQRRALEMRYLEFARAHAARRYLTGAALGIGLMAAVVLVVWTILDQTRTDVFHWVPVMAAGAIGALLSVLQRNASGTLDVKVEAAPKDLLVGGMTRPAVGVLSALAVYVLVEAGLVPLDLSTDKTELRFFYAGVGFLAGFSERFVKDAFGTAEGSIAQPP